jgi:zinc transporter ZupT
METDVTIWTVFIAASITAIFTGLGALPFLIFEDISDRWLGISNALAAGLMFGASVGLVIEGVNVQDVTQPGLRVLAGMIAGVVLIIVAHNLIEDRDDEFHIGAIEGADAVQMLLIVGVMTVHSFAEGVGVGVSYGDGASFGALISLAIAIHNIPEGLAISLVLIPKGVSVWRAAGWSVFSSIPQPIMAIPAFLFVLTFRPFLPVGLGLAAGAMFYMVVTELFPDALDDISPQLAGATALLATGAMLLFQALVG